jgi:hypothetical protein
MTEELLHFLWKHRMVNSSDLKTCDGEPIEIIHPGTHNADAGPDFFNAKVKIGNTLWAGNVEIHLRSSDWQLHNHHLNEAYNNVILHVVGHHDQEVLTQNRVRVPVMKMQTSPALHQQYHLLMEQEQWLGCNVAISQMSQLELTNWLERCLISRFEERTARIDELLAEFDNDWEQLFFLMLARSFGFGTNAQPFEMLARQTPVRALLHHADNQLQIEAILLGQAGFISQTPQCEYEEKLAREYQFLATKFSLKPVATHLWKFLRLRPVNFPTVRLAQLATFIYKIKGQFESLFEVKSVDVLLQLLDVNASGYWSHHFRLYDDEGEEQVKHLGESSRRLIIINAIIPTMYAYAVRRGNDEMQTKAFEWLNALPAENNHIIQKWSEYGLKSRNAFYSQSLIHLRKAFCEPKKCLQCRIGYYYLCKDLSKSVL